MSSLPEVLADLKQKESYLMKTQNLEQGCWSLIFELLVKMIVTEKWELHHVNHNMVKDTGKIITRKHLYENKFKKIRLGLVSS